MGSRHSLPPGLTSPTALAVRTDIQTPSSSLSPLDTQQLPHGLHTGTCPNLLLFTNVATQPAVRSHSSAATVSAAQPRKIVTRDGGARGWPKPMPHGLIWARSLPADVQSGSEFGLYVRKDCVRLAPVLQHGSPSSLESELWSSLIAEVLRFGFRARNIYHPFLNVLVLEKKCFLIIQVVGVLSRSSGGSNEECKSKNEQVPVRSGT